MSKKDLSLKTCKELREIAKGFDISGRWDMSKEELIEAILGAKGVQESAEETSAKEEEKVDNQSDVEVEEKVENESANIEVDMEQKMPYIEDAKIGSLVAFKLSNGKVKTAKVINKSTKNKKLKLQTEYGAEYIVPYVDVLWIKTGKRWPRGIYNLLKGNASNENCEKVKASC